jgi:hypothetical protein
MRPATRHATLSRPGVVGYSRRSIPPTLVPVENHVIRRLFALALLVMLLACFAFVWPSLYRYDHMTVDGDVYPVRIHRVTGHADILLPEQGWIPAEESWDQDTTPNSTSRS